MSPPGPPPPNAIAAGMLMLAGLVVGIGIGLLAGSLLGAAGPFLVLGAMLGLIAGVAAVIVRFRDL